MADSKITALTALTAADPVNDMFPVVDVSDTTMAASGTTKKISVNNILGASGTATLASATITGALTVGAAANFNGGVTAGYLNGSLFFGSSGNFTNFYCKSSGYVLYNTAGTFSVLNIDNNGVATFQDGAGSTRMTLNSTSNLVLKGGTSGASGVGVTFPATQVASSDANCLDDYEEGTWTGTLKGSTTDPTVAVTATGRYTKIGRQVYVQINFANVSTVGASGEVQISGLPFANNGSVVSQGTIVSDSILTFTGSPYCWVDLSGTTLRHYTFVSNGAASAATHNAGVARYLYSNLTYTVA